MSRELSPKLGVSEKSGEGKAIEVQLREAPPLAASASPQARQTREFSHDRATMAPSSSSKPLELPVVSFSLLAQDQHDPPHVDNSQFVQFGYNDDKEWAGYHECSADAQQGRGGRYMRWIRE